MEKKKILIIGGDNGGGSAGDQIMCEAACDFFVKNGYSVYTDAQSIDWKSPVKGGYNNSTIEKRFLYDKISTSIKIYIENISNYYFSFILSYKTTSSIVITWK